MWDAEAVRHIISGMVVAGHRCGAGSIRRPVRQSGRSRSARPSIICRTSLLLKVHWVSAGPGPTNEASCLKRSNALRNAIAHPEPSGLFLLISGQSVCEFVFLRSNLVVAASFNIGRPIEAEHRLMVFRGRGGLKDSGRVV